MWNCRSLAAFCLLAHGGLASTDSFAQVKEDWVARDGGAHGRTVVTDAVGNVYVAGNSYLDAEHDYRRDVILRKYDPQGSLLWTVEYAPGSEGVTQFANHMVSDPSGNLIITGSQSEINFLILKYDQGGNLLWQRTYPGNQGVRAATDAAGNIYVVGPSSSVPSGRNYLTVKYDPAGTLLWARTYDGTNHFDDDPTALAVAASGEVAVTGQSTGGVTSFDIATVAYDTNGNERWVRRYDNAAASRGDYGSDLAFGASGEVYVCGTSSNGSDLDIVLIQYDAAGNEAWVRRYDGTHADDARRVGVDSHGDAIVVGYVQQANSDLSALTAKYDPNGNLVWLRTYESGDSGDNPRSIAIGADDAVYLTGDGGMGAQDYFTVKYDANGNREWAVHYVDPDPQSDAGNSIALDPFGNVIVTGGTPFVTVKYVQAGPTSVDPGPAARARLHQNAPNPFRAGTMIAFSAEVQSLAEIEIYDVAGRRVRTLLAGPQGKGLTRFWWDGRDEMGAPVRSGTYLYRLRVDGRSVETRRGMLVR